MTIQDLPNGPGHVRPTRHTLGSEYLGERPRNDHLGTSEMAKQICRDLEANHPAVIGVFGRWGVGKTHLLNQIGQLLSKEHKVCCFRAWEYEAEGDLRTALIRSLVNEHSYPFNGPVEKEGMPFFPRRETARKLAWGLCSLALDVATDMLGTGGKTARKAIDLLIKASQEEREKLPVPTVDQFHTQMAEMVSSVLGDDGHLFVLIDDLDRCSPPNVIRLFEWFKNHLDTPRCSYVLAIDQRMAARAVVGQYRSYVSQSDEEEYGYHYLHKLLERDYEIQPSPRAQTMAMSHLGMAGNDVVDWTAKVLKRTFAGGPEMMSLLAVSDLWVPRLMIRVLSTYRLAIEALRSQSKQDGALLTNDIDIAFPFWLLFLSTTHHLLVPDRVEPFVADVGNAPREQQQNLGKRLLGELKPIAPHYELMVRLDQLALAWPASRQLDYLYRIVREKTPRSFREV